MKLTPPITNITSQIPISSFSNSNSLLPPQPFIPATIPVQQTYSYLPNPKDKIYDPVLPDKVPLKQVSDSIF